MRPLIVFLNELSYACDGLSAEQIRPYVLSSLEAMREIKRLRKSVIFYGEPTINNLAFGGGQHSLGAVLNGDEYKDEWLQIRTWAQASSNLFSPVIQGPHRLISLSVAGEEARGLLWAFTQESFSVSIGGAAHWITNEITGLCESTDEEGNLSARPVVIRNISTREHIPRYQEELIDAGLQLSASSLVYEGAGFVVRMFFNDHDPPHIHILARRDATETIVKYVISTQDILDGRFPPNLERQVRDWTGRHQEELLENWDRVRNGIHPILVS